jgi:hypothetical protein
MPSDSPLLSSITSSIWWAPECSNPTVESLLDILNALSDRLVEIYKAAGLDTEWIVQDGGRSGYGSGVHISSDAPPWADYRWVALPQFEPLRSRVIAAVLDCLSRARVACPQAHYEVKIGPAGHEDQIPWDAVGRTYNFR